MLGSTGPWSFCCRLGGAAGSQPQCGVTALLLLLPRRFLFHFPSSCYVVIIAHAHAARRGVTRRAVTSSIETVAVIATGGGEQRPPAAWWRRREMQRSYERRRWRRDGGRGGAGLSRRGACCCGVRIIHFLFSEASFSSWAPAKRAAAAPPPSSPLQRPGQAGDENTPPPLRIAPQPPAGKKGATRGRVFFVTAWQRGGPCQVASFFLFFIKAAPAR